MIDFRYHVVSLVAVFLALATGIVIGGFSLRGEVADQLNSQVVQLRGDKSALQKELNQATTGGRKRDEGVTELAPRVLAGALPGKGIALVVLPEVDEQLVRSVTQSVRSAGGSVTTTVTLKEDWAKPGFARSSTMRGHASKLGIDVNAMQADRLSGAVLARALVRQDAGARQVLAEIEDADTAEFSDLEADPAAGVMVVWPGMVDKDGVAKRWAAVIGGVGVSIEASVGVASGGVSTDDGPKPDALISIVRDTPDVVSTMSTVDDGAIPLGQIAAGLAMRDELAGKSGQYGFGRDASAVVPRLEPAVASTEQ